MSQKNGISPLVTALKSSAQKDAASFNFSHWSHLIFWKLNYWNLKFEFWSLKVEGETTRFGPTSFQSEQLYNKNIIFYDNFHSGTRKSAINNNSVLNLVIIISDLSSSIKNNLEFWIWLYPFRPEQSDQNLKKHSQ